MRAQADAARRFDVRRARAAVLLRTTRAAGAAGPGRRPDWARLGTPLGFVLFSVFLLEFVPRAAALASLLTGLN